MSNDEKLFRVTGLAILHGGKLPGGVFIDPVHVPVEMTRISTSIWQADGDVLKDLVRAHGAKGGYWESPPHVEPVPVRADDSDPTQQMADKGVGRLPGF